MGDFISTHSDHTAFYLKLKINHNYIEQNNIISGKDFSEIEIYTRNQSIKELCENYDSRCITQKDTTNEKIKTCLNSEHIKCEL